MPHHGLSLGRLRPALVAGWLGVGVASLFAGASTAADAGAAAPEQRIDLGTDLQVRPVAPGVFVVVHAFPWPANALLVEMDDGTLVLAGSTYTAEAAQRVLAWARERFGFRRMVAINTGYHCDNLGGNAALEAAGIPVYGSDLTVRLLRERGEASRQTTLRSIGDKSSRYYQAHAASRFVPPDHVFPLAEGLTLTFGAERVQVLFPGPSQAPDKVVVDFPSRRLLFGSCLVLAGDRPGNTADADLAAWPDAIRKLARIPADTVIPGHGDRIDPGLLPHTLDLLAGR